MAIDNEIRAVALLALKNAYYTAFSDLVQSYLEAAKGLEDDALIEMQLGGLSDVFSREKPTDRDEDYYPLICTGEGGSGFLNCIHGSLVEALEHPAGTFIELEEKLIFERDEAGEWQYVGA